MVNIRLILCKVSVCLLIFFVGSIQCKDCQLKTPCSCEFDDGSGTVDLTSLGNTDDTPKFKDVECKDEGYFYSYNPCKGFSEDDCEGASVCVLNEDKSESQQIGDYGRGAFKYDDESEKVLAAYTSGRGVLKLTTVTLVCDPHACTPTLTAQGEQNPGQFALTMTSVCACPGLCTASGPTHCSAAGAGAGGISGGSILLIVVFTLVIIYFIAGIMLSKYVRKKEGKEVIPNVIFWQTLPIFIKIRFVEPLILIIYLIQGTCGKPAYYEQTSSTMSTNPTEILVKMSRVVLVVRPNRQWYLTKVPPSFNPMTFASRSTSSKLSSLSSYRSSLISSQRTLQTTSSPEMTTITTSPTPSSAWLAYWTSKSSSSSQYRTSYSSSSRLSSYIPTSSSVDTPSKLNSASSVVETQTTLTSSKLLSQSSSSSSKPLSSSSKPFSSSSISSNIHSSSSTERESSSLNYSALRTSSTSSKPHDTSSSSNIFSSSSSNSPFSSSSSESQKS